jgi:hypothetical protein
MVSSGNWRSSPWYSTEWISFSLAADDQSAPRFAPGSGWSIGEHLRAKIFLIWVRSPRWRAIIPAATRPLLILAISGHRRRSPPFIHAAPMWPRYCRGEDVASPYEWISLEAAVDHQQRPAMVITIAMVAARCIYKFIASPPPPFKSTELRPSSLNCKAVTPAPTLD